jgi:hypothetical protein
VVWPKNRSVVASGTATIVMDCKSHSQLQGGPAQGSGPDAAPVRKACLCCCRVKTVGGVVKQKHDGVHQAGSATCIMQCVQQQEILVKVARHGQGVGRHQGNSVTHAAMCQRAALYLGLGSDVVLPNWLPGVVSTCCLLPSPCVGVLLVGLGMPDTMLRCTGGPAPLRLGSAAVSSTLLTAAAPPTRCLGLLAPAAPGLPTCCDAVLLLLAVLCRLCALGLRVPVLPVSAELLGDSRSPLLCFGGESKWPSAAGAAACNCRHGTAKPLLCSAAHVPWPCAASCIPLLRSLGASCGEKEGPCWSWSSLSPLMLPLVLPVRGCDFTRRLGVSSCTGAAEGQGVRSMSEKDTGAMPVLTSAYPPAACRGVNGDASPAAVAAPAGRLFATGVMVDSASSGTTGLRWAPWGVVKLLLAGCCCCLSRRLLLLLPSAGQAAMPEMRPRKGDPPSSAPPSCWCWQCWCCCWGPLGAARGSPEPCLTSPPSPPSASLGTALADAGLLCTAAA